MDSALLVGKVKELMMEASALIGVPGSFDIKKKGPRDFVTQIDVLISELFCRRLPELLPGSSVLSEECAPPTEGAEFTWIIDPVDGTTNLIYGLPLFAISVGLLRAGKPVLGVVYNPSDGEMFSAFAGGGAFLGDRRIRVNADDSLSRTLVLVETDPYLDRALNRSPELIKTVFQDCIDYRITGSAALDICYIAAGRGGVFFTQSLKPWDYTGGSVVLLEAGGSVSLWDGSPLPFAGKHSFLASNGVLHGEILEKTKAFIARLD
jgi:myo-inositol-1(or 4)-monophosphatase